MSGILTDEQGRVLLVRRSAGDPEMGGLWSLPAGEVEPGEPVESALAREFLEETGLEVSVGDLVTRVSRPHWYVDGYEVARVAGELTHGLDPDIADVAFWPLPDLPERMVLEARVAVLRHWLAAEPAVDARAYAQVTEGLFAALFYSYLASELERFGSLECLPILSSVVTGTPLRKFKSVIPFLISGRDERARCYSLIPELLFAMWTILDDLCDQREQRYGSVTAHVRFGHPRTLSFLLGGLEALRLTLAEMIGVELADELSRAMLGCARSQTARFAGTQLAEDAYLDLAAGRTEFLGVAWSVCLRALGCPREARLLHQLHRQTARLGQVVNDYYDVRPPGELRDFRSGVWSFYTIKLAEVADGIDEIWDRRQDPAADRTFRDLIDRHRIVDAVRADALTRLESIVASVAELQLPVSQRTVIRAWVELAVQNLLPPDAPARDFRQQALDTLESIEVLSAGLS